MNWMMVMGINGIGTFDNDEASWYLGTIFEQLIKTVEDGFVPPFNLSDGEARIVSSVDILATLSKTYQEPPKVDEAVVRHWRESYLKLYDERIDYLGVSDEFKVKRRQVIEETFNRLEELALYYHI